MNWSPKKDELLYQCPCCDYYTFFERGIAQICFVCYWEDDEIELVNPDRISTRNNLLTLREARANFDKYGAFDKSFVGLVLLEDKLKFQRFPRTLVPNKKADSI